MNLGTYGILIAFGLFIVILIFNPRISCFGKRVRSPFYPLLRKGEEKKKSAPQAQDYGFHLVDQEKAEPGTSGEPKKKPVKKTDDYGFRLD